MIEARCYAPIRSVPRPNDRCTSDRGEEADRPEKDRWIDGQIVRKRKKRSKKCVCGEKERKREKSRTARNAEENQIGGQGRRRSGKGMKEKEGTISAIGETRGENYTAFVSDGVFNDLSTSRSL